MKTLTQPVETYLFFLFPLVAVVILSIFDSTFLSEFSSLSYRTILFHLFFSESLIEAVVGFSFLYGFIKFSFFLYACASKLFFKEAFEVPKIPLRARILSALYLILGICLITFTNNFLLFSLEKTPVEKVHQASLMLASWDLKLFNTHVAFALQDVLPFSVHTIALQVYRYFSGLVALIVLVTLTTRTEVYRQFVLSFVLTFLFSVPFWALFPGISPEEMFRQRITNVNLEEIEDSATIKNASYTAELVLFLEELKPVWSDASKGRFSVSCFPSMHVAWGVLVVWFGFLMSKWFGLFLLPFALFNTLGAVSTLQHYAVDIPAGVLVAVIAILFSGKLVRMGDASVKQTLFSLLAQIQYDVSKLTTRLRLLVGYSKD